MKKIHTWPGIKLTRKQKSVGKSLTPMIVFFSLIILLTIVLINTQSKDQIVFYDQNELLPPMKLSPFSNLARRRQMRRSNHDASLPKIDSAEIERLFLDAEKYYVSGKLPAAADRLKTLLVFRPNHFPSLAMLGDIYYRTGKYKEAEMIFRNQIRKQPDDAMAFNNLGLALAKQGKFKEAIKAETKALDIQPESPSYMLNLSGMYSVSGDKNASIEYFRKAYECIGDKIIPISYAPTLDNIRNEPEFKQIINEAQKKRK